MKLKRMTSLMLAAFLVLQSSSVVLAEANSGTTNEISSEATVLQKAPITDTTGQYDIPLWSIGDTVPHPTKGDVVPKYYRIPAVTVSAQGTLIAAADMRYDTANDNLGHIAIGVKRSKDGGQTWSPTTIAVPMPIKDGQPTSPRARSMDTTILSAKDGKLYILTGTWKSNRANWAQASKQTPDPDWAAYLASSEDDGVTWKIEKTWDSSNIRELSNEPIVAFLGGVGTGIQMEDGTLVFPIDICLTNGTHNSVKATVLYSKDNGLTWELGKGYANGVSENNVIESSEGVLLMNGRKDGSGSRAVYYSTDLGDSWKPHVDLDRKIKVKNPQTQGAFVKIELENGEEVALLSTPKNNSASWQRDNITLWATYDYKSWVELGTLYAPRGNAAGAGYSGLAGGLDENGKGYLYFIYEKQGEIAFRDISEYLTMINEQSTANAKANVVDRVNDSVLVQLDGVNPETKKATNKAGQDTAFDVLGDVQYENGYYEFNGNTQNIIKTTDESYMLTDDFTIEFDFIPTGFEGINWDWLFVLGQDGTDQIDLGLALGEKEATKVFNPGLNKYSLDTAGTWEVGKEYHVSVTVKDGITNFYVDNELVYSREGHLTASPTSLSIGNISTHKKNLLAKIGEFTIYNKALTPIERDYTFNKSNANIAQTVSDAVLVQLDGINKETGKATDKSGIDTKFQVLGDVQNENGYYVFNGNTQNIIKTTAADYMLTKDFTIEFDFTATGFGGANWDWLFVLGSEGTHDIGLGLALGDEGATKVFNPGLNKYSRDTEGTLELNKEYHVSVTVEDGLTNFYVDNVLLYSKNSHLTENPTSLSIGNISTNSKDLSAKIGNFTIYNKALNAVERTYTYEA